MEQQSVDNCYVLLDRLGQGGMGTVYRALNRLTGQTVALKLVGSHQHGSSSEEDDDAARTPKMALVREFQTLSSLHHPNLVEVLSYGIDEQSGPYFTMELLEKPQTILEAAQGKSTEGKVALFSQLLRSLIYVHRRGVLHRDLKPSNVLCVEDQVKLLDFGISTKHATAMEMAGTPEYMAPELLVGQPPSVASELYAAGIIAHQMLTGRFPFERGASKVKVGSLRTEADVTMAKSMFQMLDSFLNSGLETDPSTVTRFLAREADTALQSEELDCPFGEVIRRLLARAPEQRYPDARSVLEDLQTRLGSQVPIETAETRESFLQASDLVGREAELGQLTAALQRATEGHGSNWLLGGEGGVGKSRLVLELRTQALVAGTSVLTGQAVAEGGSHYQLWISVLRLLCLRVPPSDAEAAVLKELIPDLAALLDRPLRDPPPVQPELVQQRLFLTIEALLRRAGKPTVVLLEDLHWAGPESLTLLNRLSELSQQVPLLLLATFRDDEFPDLPLRLPRMKTQRLGRLDTSAVIDLAASMLGEAGKQPWLVDYLCRHTEGNVFFLIEVVRALAEQLGQLSNITTASTLPEQIFTVEMERIADRRMERLAAEHRPALELAAILGRKFDLKVLQQLVPALDLRSWLTTCAQAALLETQDGEWRFAHDKLREGILLRMPTEDRRLAHARIARVIQALYPEVEDSYPVLAHHFRQAGLPDEAASYYLRAGQGATRLCAYAAARQHFGFALTELQQIPATASSKRRTIDVLLWIVRTSQTADRPEVNLDRLRQAATLLGELTSEDGETDWLRQAWIAYWSGRLHYYRNQLKPALVYCEQVLRIANEHAHSELRTLANSAYGTALLCQGRMGPALRRLTSTIETYAAINHEYEWVRAVGNSGLCLVGLGQYQRGMQELKRAHQRAVSIGQPIIISMTHLYNSMAGALSGDWPMTLSDGQHALALARQHGEQIYVSLAQKHIAWAESHLGNHAEAFENYRRSEETVQAMGGRLLWSDLFDAVYAGMLCWAGRYEEAMAQAKRVVGEAIAANSVMVRGMAEREWGLALHASGRGSPDAVDRHVEQSLEVFSQSDLVLEVAHTRLLAARIYRERGAQERADAAVERALIQYEASGCTYALHKAQDRGADPPVLDLRLA